MGEEAQLQVVMLPWLAQGHINPLINLSKALASHGDVKVWIVSTPENISRIRARLHDEPIHLLELALPSVDGLPPGVECTADIKPESVHLLHSAFDQLDKPFESLLRRLSPNFLVYDIVAPWAATVAAQLDIPSFVFSIFNPAAFSYFVGHCKAAASSRYVKAEDLTQLPTDYPVPIISWRLFEARLGYNNFIAFADRVWACCQQSCGIVIKSCFEEEDKYLKYLTHITGKPVISVGPLVIAGGATEDKSGNFVVEWLDKQRPSSVVFVAFGSESFLSAEQITELALALENIGLHFLWSLRSSDVTSSALSLLPEGFEGRTRDRGLVVGGWVPQLRILSHPSVGSFVTHGGWSSVMEAWLYSGLPLVLIPLRNEQGLNSRQIELELNAGIEVERNEDGGFSREDVCKAVWTVMGNEEKGEQIRSKVRELRGVIDLNTGRQQAYMEELVNQMKKFIISRREDYIL
ncbi:hypothetical protein SUGI_0653380 [Cryptomeria japonica]|uniref:anthocyanidin-3-O-glucoside rhamnosyltransferase-like n=1 Tax=Cryptomeria japonica TaxID=3369 RepID=UPI002414AD6A|nr:anthocyanidin-3-O-glucoside rhamnosyltransferase-like [Cryptomeria japonica]GLJ32477.1 hypothetical protein SUGI_0653380 [Cryptomeria japonica]